MASAPIAALRRFVRSREPEEHCDTCGRALTSKHRHTFEPKLRRIRCSCDSCLPLQALRYREIPKRVIPLPNFQMTDAQWDSLMIPIALAFFSYNTPEARVIALYPGPAGAAESLLDMSAWEDLSAANPELATLQPDVEALLINRIGQVRQYFIVPIDECYKLVGLIRLHWRGLSGGAQVWGQIGQYFASLQQKGNACQL